MWITDFSVHQIELNLRYLLLLVKPSQNFILTWHIPFQTCNKSCEMKVRFTKKRGERGAPLDGKALGGLLLLCLWLGVTAKPRQQLPACAPAVKHEQHWRKRELSGCTVQWVRLDLPRNWAFKANLLQWWDQSRPIFKASSKTTLWTRVSWHTNLFWS